MPVIQNVGGWNPWHYLKSYIGGVVVPYAQFPNTYLPASGVWVQTPSYHCYIPVPWTQAYDMYTEFARTAGNAPGTLIGAIAGLGRVAELFAESKTITMAIGLPNKPPQVGYCIGNLYKEHSYFYFQVYRPAPDVLLTTTYSDVFQRSKARRLYLYQGSVVRYTVEEATGKRLLTLDMDGNLPDGKGPIIVGSKIKIIRKRDGGTVEVTVSEVRDNWDFVISDPGTPVPTTGDFYVFNKIFCIRDPYRLCGDWLGVEADRKTSYPDSGKNLHVTSQNHFYDKVVFTGAYVCFNKVTNEMTYVNAGSTMNNTGDLEWRWAKFSTYTQSSIFGSNADRYTETEVVTDTETDSSSFQVVKRNTATIADVNAWIALAGSTYVRLEINRGGSSGAHNWQAPMLENAWLKQNGKYFKIIGQADGSTIDVSFDDATGTAVIDPDLGGEIFNQYGWFISEHFMDEEAKGIFGCLPNTADAWAGTFSGGTTAATALSTVAINTPGENRSTLVSTTSLFAPSYLSPNSYYKRFRDDTAPMGGTIKAFNKIDGWWLNSEDGTTFRIKSISYSAYPTASNTEYKVTVIVYGDINTISKNSELWVTFDEPYKRMSNYSKNGVYTSDVSEIIEFIPGVGDVPTLCVDWNFQSAPIAINIPKNTIVGICGGLWWGMQRPVAVSNNGLDLLVTTPSANHGISCVFSDISQSDHVFYQDVYTKRLTIRRGDLDFRETPTKIEISIGVSESTATASSFPIKLNQGKERLKSIHMDMPAGTYSACTFRLGNTEDYHGFLINGGGIVDFQVARRLGSAPGTIPPSRFNYKGYYASPCYIYNADPSVSPLKTKILYLGMAVKDDPIYVSTGGAAGGSPSNMKLEYVKNNQTLEKMSLYDAHEMNDGELIVVYGRPVTSAFTIDGGDGEVNNSSGNPWISKNGVFIIGSGNSGYQWGCPIVKDLKFKDDEKYQYSLMVLNNTDYAGSIFDRRSETLSIFSKCYHKSSSPFMGMLKINVLGLPTNVKLCTSSVAGEQKFLWREPLLSTALVNDPNRTYTPPEYIIGAPAAAASLDEFIRVMGPDGTKSSITSNIEDWGIISTHILNDGTYIMLYDTAEGVKLISSSSTGSTWSKSRIILARDASSARLVGQDLLCYITTSGIEVKVLTEMDMLRACSAIEGVSDTSVEELQKYFDYVVETRLIGSGRIGAQRLAGYKSIEGVYKIFYYDPNNLLACLQSSDRARWIMAPNF